MKPITGTFIDEITYDIPSQNWGPAEWHREFDTMREAGIDTVVIIRAGLRDMALFPSEALGIADVPDLAQLFLDEAARCGMALFFGCYDSDNMGREWENWKRDWEVNRALLPEIHRRYGKHPAFQGWYISPEHARATPGTLEVFRRYSELMKELANKPVLISPFFPSVFYRRLTPEERRQRFIEDWHRIFEAAPAIDICAFQDTTCSPHPVACPLFELEDYLRAIRCVCDEKHVTLWNNVESFARNMPIKFPPIDWRLLRRKMTIADPYVEKHITFEFSHFMSPNSMYPSARMLFERYREAIIG